MKDVRELHTATPLQDGRVLVADGSTSASAELYDPEPLSNTTGASSLNPSTTGPVTGLSA
ncbi:hypothetical protein OHA79_00645 [Streptomyces sp. NBC_00841]|uniref:hypothetical protein n=1 Tax=Streptomyces sp. NBC_00841 TaxID=2975847 RepID=UPI002DD7A325|nr:hypothetical protein [Streptomyces sp. NBC_00841]WRZ96606.1 hypothetical protein OHA79_00645 [Streptomyces sp. NBC_00841]